MSMVATCTLCKIRYVNLHVRGTSVKASASFECGRLTATVYATEPSHVLYFFSFLKPNTYHRISGTVALSAYTNRETKKAVYFCNITLEDVNPTNIVSVTSPTLPATPSIGDIPNNDLCSLLARNRTLKFTRTQSEGSVS